MLSDLSWPKVITISGAYSISISKLKGSYRELFELSQSRQFNQFIKLIIMGVVPAVKADASKVANKPLKHIIMQPSLTDITWSNPNRP
jgi:hypothetical protein